MIAHTLESALKHAREAGIPRVIEIKCPRPSCGHTIYALTDGEDHEHRLWLKEFRQKAMKRFIYCKYCGYGSTSDTEGHFVFETHQVPQS